MVYLIDTNKPYKNQVINVVSKEVIKYPYDYILVGSSNPEVCYDFIFPEKTTIFVHDKEADCISDEELENLKTHNVLYLDGEHNLQHLYHSASQRFRTLFPAEIMALTVNCLEKSIKKCLEIAVTAVDKKYLPAGSRVISISGESEHPDTAIVLEPSSSDRIIDTRIIKIICHPYHEEW